MSPAVKSDSSRSSSSQARSLVPVGEVGTLLVEQRSSTPLGPRIVEISEELTRLSGYEPLSLVGTPLGLIYDRSDIASLIRKLPVIASRGNHCFMDRILLRNGGSRRLCRWTIRPSNRDGERPGYFVLTVQTVAPAVESPQQVAPAEPQPQPQLPPYRESAPVSSVPPQAAPQQAPPKQAAPQAERDLEQCRSRSLSLAVAGVAHDFKNALQTIKTNLEMAGMASPPTSPVGINVSEAMLALDDAETLAQQMLAFTRGESARRQVFQLDPLLQRVSRLGSAGSEIRCRLHIPKALRCVEGDPNQIYQVLHNLVINARQAMPNGGTIDIVAANADLGRENPFQMAAGRYTVVSVRDRGCGIPPEILHRIFEADFTTKTNGNGFGLASCQSIVDQHGGQIRVASKVGVGTEFLVFLPSSDASQISEPVASAKAPASTFPRRPVSGAGRVLVVEDQPGVARSTAGILKQFGYDCLLAHDGGDALSMYRERLDSHEPVEVVLLDMTLPGGLSGLDVAREIHRMDPFAKIVATSGYFEEGMSIPGEGQFAGVLPKPYGMEELSEAIGAAITA